ncbi:MAG TPA: carbohydrate kinase [Jiangellaceae bacterium]|nr:carbohydrate kinase [Jiangellaceae bacterium]
MIVVAGESLIDMVPAGDGVFRAVPGGGPFNVARTIARLGEPCSYLGSLSTDGFGQLLRKNLVDSQVDDSYAPSTDAPTTLALAWLDDAGAASYLFYVDGTSAAALDVDQARRVLQTAPHILYVGTLGLVLEPMASSVETLVIERSADVLLVVDPNCRPALLDAHQAARDRLDRIMARADVVKVSTEDAAYLYPDRPADDAAMAIHDHGARVVLLTDGANDVRVITGSEPLRVPVPRVAIADTIGAGDSFCGGFVAWWHQHDFGRPQLSDGSLLKAATEFATAVSAVTCQRVGADPPWAHELADAGWP